MKQNEDEETKYDDVLIQVETNDVPKKGKVDILNVKNTPEKINALIDHIHYFPAYHMNKKHWISILLDRTVQITQVEKLLDESYQLVTKK